MKDRLVAGSLAGMIAGLIEYGFGLVALKLRLTDRMYGQFSDVAFAGRVFTGTLGAILSIVTHLAVTIMAGVLFAYIIALTSSRYYLVKGAGYGFALWFLFGVFGTVWRLPLFDHIPVGPALVMLVGAVIYGTSLGYTLKVLDRRSNLL